MLLLSVCYAPIVLFVHFSCCFRNFEFSNCVLNVMSLSIIVGQIDIDVCRPTIIRNRHILFKRNIA